jgi:hypothetical protein
MIESRVTYRLILIGGALLCASGSRGLCETKARNSDKQAPEPSDVKHGSIKVHLKGYLMITSRLKADADPNSNPRDDSAHEVTNAQVMTGGMEVTLDWNGNEAIHDRLVFWRQFHHGDFRSVQAEVTGDMKFVPAHEAGGGFVARPGFNRDSLVPVVVVDTLTVQLVAADGRPRGPQPDGP